MNLIKSTDSLPPFNQLVLAWLDGYAEHSDQRWKRSGWAFMVRHQSGPTVDDQWSLSHYNRAILGMDAHHADVTHWAALPEAPTR